MIHNKCLFKKTFSTKFKINKCHKLKKKQILPSDSNQNISLNLLKKANCRGLKANFKFYIAIQLQ